MNTLLKIEELLRVKNADELREFDANTYNLIIIGELEEFRARNDIPKKEFAQAAGVSASYLSQVLAGYKQINLKMIAGICRKYNLQFKTVIIEKELKIPSEKFEVYKPHLDNKETLCQKGFFDYNHIESKQA